MDEVVGIIRELQAASYEAMKFKPGQSLPEIQDEYRGKLERIMAEYADSSRPVTAFRNEMRRAANDAMNMAALAGWIDGGGSGPIPDKLQDIVNSRIDAEIGFIDELFNKLRELKKGDNAADLDNYISNRADGYAATLLGVYATGKGIAGTDRPGKWIYGGTEDHCETCEKLHDTVHPLSWYIENGYIPQQQGSETLECGGWNCQCSVVDPESGEQLMP